MIDETHIFAKKSNAAEIFVELRGALTSGRTGSVPDHTQSKQTPIGDFPPSSVARSVRDGKNAHAALPVLYELPDRWRAMAAGKTALLRLVNQHGGVDNEDFLAQRGDGPR